MSSAPSVAILTATNRPEAENFCTQQWLKQDYPNGVHYVNKYEGNHGKKMDQLFQWASRNEFYVVHDDDDTYAEYRVSRLIQPMLDDPRILCVGTSLVYYFDARVKKAWLYDNAKLPKSMFWMGAPAYRREAYELYGPWEDLKCGADLKFLQKIPRERVIDLRDPTLMLCQIHDRNAAGKQTVGPAWTEVEWESLPKL